MLINVFYFQSSIQKLWICSKCMVIILISVHFLLYGKNFVGKMKMIFCCNGCLSICTGKISSEISTATNINPTPDRGPLSHIVVACNCSINLLEYRFLPYWTGQDFRLDCAKKGEGEGTPSECFPLTFCKFMAFI